MKKTICILALLFLPLLLGGCGGKAEPMELPEIEVPVIEVESETESESETEFVFSDMTVYHGILVTESDLGYASGPFRREEATKLKETLLCTSYQEYREYIEMVKLTWPDADVYKFPDIPAEWFEIHVNQLMDAIKAGADLPPLIVHYLIPEGKTDGEFELNDGNHRLEAYNRLGTERCHIIFWCTEKHEYEQLMERYGHLMK